MKIVFMGSAKFALASLEKLHLTFEVVAVFTQPDRPAGRGLKNEITPVKKLAGELKIPLFQPEKLKNNPEILEVFKKLQPDLIVVVAYGLFLPSEIFTLPRLGAINLHASLLPQYRGAAPIPWAILNGEKKSGVSVILINEKMDAGDIMAQKETAIGENETAGEVEKRLAEIGAELMGETVNKIEAGNFSKKKQNEAEVSFAPGLRKKDALINWPKPALKIKNKIRAFNPRPGAYTFHQSQFLKIWQAEILSPDKTQNFESFPPGAIVKISQEGALVKTGKGFLNLLQIQSAGGKIMTPYQYSLGHLLEAGNVFENQ